MSGEGQQLLQLMQLLVSSNSDNDIRAAAAKLSSTVLTAGCSGSRSACDLLLAGDGQLVQRYVTTMKGVSDTQSLVHLTNVLAECLKDKECSGEVCRRLTDAGGTEVMVAALRSLGPASQQYQTVTALYTILYKIGKKDPRFPVRLRLCGGLKVLLRRLQDNAQKCRVCVPALQCIKLAAGNDQNVVVLGRGEAVEHLCRLVPHLWNMSGLKQQLTLECTARLVRNRLNRRRLLKENVIPRLLLLLQPRHKLEKKTQYNVQKAALSVIFVLAELKPGRDALLEARVCDVMQSFLRSCPPAERYDRLFCRAANTILRCVAKWSLPVAKLESPVSFTLPVLNNGADKDDAAEAGSDDDSSSETEPDTEPEAETETEAENDEESPACSALVNSHSVCPLPDAVRVPAADLLRCARLFSELAGPPPSGSPPPPSGSPPPPHTPLPSVASAGLSPAEKGGGCQCLPHCLTRLCRQRAGVRPCPPVPPAAGSEPGGTTEAMVTGLRLERAWERLAERPDRRGQGDVRRQYTDVYRRLAQETRHVAPFVKLAYPDLVGAVSTADREPLGSCDRMVCRRKVQGLVDDALGRRSLDSEVVYDYDLLVSTFSGDKRRVLDNHDEKTVSTTLIEINQDSSLRFESRFESGNLRRSIRTGPREYDLVICPDVGSSRHQQWFYFEVSNMRADLTYTFNLVNNEKLSCEYQTGMRPVLFSVKEALRGRPFWVRAGQDVFYYRNAYRRPARHPATRRQGRHNRTYCTASFSICFPHDADVCYLAFHYPYTYTRMRTLLELLEHSVPPDVCWRTETLTSDLDGNPAPLVTVTGHTLQHKKEVVFLTARIHPGESGASWALEGTLRFLLGDTPEAEALRDRFIFKLVPMLNVAGVVNGCHRCGLTDEDLNRRWRTPDPRLHPVIYRAKAMMEYSTFMLKRTPYLFCDYHGHSCRKNIFLYGCSNRRSWLPSDRQMPDNEPLVSCLPQVLYRVAPAFSLRCCHLSVERSREATARVVVWRELGVQRSYTLESSYCGCDQGPYQGCHLSTEQLTETGGRLCVALHLLSVPGDLASLERARAAYWWRPQEELEREFAASSSTNSDITGSDDDTDGVTSGTVT